MKEEFFKYIKENHNIDLNEKQEEAVTSVQGPVLVLACPGSGKTTVLNARIAYLIAKHNINPRNILALTFSKAAARDMGHRFSKIYGEIVKDEVRFSTIHSFAYRVLIRYYRGNNINYEMIEGNKGRFNKKSILKGIYKSINRTNINEDKLEDLVNAISFVKNLMIEPKDFSTYKFQIRGFERIYEGYEEYKKNNEMNKVLLDFDDMLIESLKIMENNPTILRKLQSFYKYILIDEGQDTSLVQNKIIELLAKPQNNLFIVCDDDQSIYGFRGADPSYLLDFEKRYRNSKVIYMEKNYRSTNNIVEISNSFIAHNKMRYPKNMNTNNPPQKPVKIIRLDSERDQIKYLINSIANKERLSDVAVLYRNNISSTLLVQMLYENGIPFYMKDYYRNFFNHWVLKDILNFVRFSYDKNNVHLLESIYTKFNSYISKKEIDYLKGGVQTKSVFHRLINMPGIPEIKKRGLRRFDNDFNYLKDLKPQKAIKFIKEDLKYLERIEGYCDVVGLSLDNAKNMLSILELLSNGTNTMQEFVDKLNHLKKIMHESKSNKYSNCITLSTLHSAKGLEFKTVYMIDLIDGELPGTDSIKSSGEGDTGPIEEDRRLWYVGMTRAKDELELITIGQKHGERTIPSRFIGEVEIYNPETKEYIKKLGFETSSIIRHKRFGLGMIKDIASDKITIDFDEKGIKELAIDICLKKNLIELVKYKE